MRDKVPAAKGAGSVGAAISAAVPKPKPPAQQAGGYKQPRPHHVAGLQRADQIVQHIRHYAENPKLHAKALRDLGLTAQQIRAVHTEQVSQVHIQPHKTSILAGIGHMTGLKVVDQTLKDLTEAAVYTPAGLYQAGAHPWKTAKAMPGQLWHDVRHPLSHPGYTALDILGVAAPVAGVGARVGAASRAARAGEGIASALTRKTIKGGSLLHAPPPGRITHRVGNLTVETPASRNVLRRQVQKARATRANAKQGDAAIRAAGKGLQRQSHIEAQIERAPAELLQAQGAKLRKSGMQTALRVVAEGKPAEDRIRFHIDQAKAATSKTVRRDHLRQARLLKAAAKYVVTVGGKPMIRADAPVVGKVYGQLKSVGAQREAILRDTGQMTEQGLEARKHQPGQVIETGKPTGEGVSDFKGGRVYVPGYTTEPRLPGGVMSQPSGKVVGRVKSIVSKNKPYTGEALLKGKVPDNTTGLVARQTLRAVRYLQSDRFRSQVLKAAHDERQGEHDVLVNDRTLKNPTLTPEAKAVLGKERYTLDELSGHATAFQEFQRKLFPMKDTKDLSGLSAEERLAAQSGGKVPGYKWVDERLLRGANKPASYVTNKAARGAVGVVDSINNATKMAVLYLKPAYAIPNIAGNVFLNLVQQGFAAPRNLKMAAYLSHKVGDQAAATLDSVMGEGVAQSIASEAGKLRGAVNFAAGKWSKVVDLPFRRAAFIHEARKLGYATPEKLRALLTDETHRADLLEATQRATDSIIDYSNLSEMERNVIRRVIFFYPWVKGSTRYGGHFIMEHPTQAATTAQLARQGKQRAGLGPVPSYLEGSFKVKGKLVNPASAGIFGTGAQVIQGLQGLAEGKTPQAGALPQFLTPAAAVALANITRQSSLGVPFKPGAGFGDIAQQTLLDQLPQVSLYRRAKALMTGADQSKKLFPAKSVSDVVSPFVIGGVAPRSYNPAVMHAQATKEQRGLLTPEQRNATDFKQFATDLRAAYQKHGAKAIHRDLAARMNLWQERINARTQEAGGHKVDTRTAYKADMKLILHHGWVTEKEANALLKWSAKAPTKQVSVALRYFTTHYFDRDGLLHDSVKWFRDNGSPDLTVPALP